MDTELEYQKIISGIKQGHRALTRFRENELEELLEKLKIHLSSKNLSELEKILCLLDHSAGLCPPAGSLLLEVLNTDLPDPLLIFALNAARRHIIIAQLQRGHRLNFDFLETLKKLLYSSSPEVVEWTLRTIEECGNQGVYFLREFDKIKPAPWKWFNPHQRAVREIITMLERRWSRFEKSKPGS